jgi:hypothetical protein
VTTAATTLRILTYRGTGGRIGYNGSVGVATTHLHAKLL